VTIFRREMGQASLQPHSAHPGRKQLPIAVAASMGGKNLGCIRRPPLVTKPPLPSPLLPPNYRARLLQVRPSPTCLWQAVGSRQPATLPRDSPTRSTAPLVLGLAS
jgi:hypothetical protein